MASASRSQLPDPSPDARFTVETDRVREGAEGRVLSAGAIQDSLRDSPTIKTAVRVPAIWRLGRPAQNAFMGQ